MKCAHRDSLIECFTRQNAVSVHSSLRVDSTASFHPCMFVVACRGHMQWEDSEEAGRQQSISGRILVFLLVFGVPLAFEWQSLCSLNLPLKNPGIYSFKCRVSMSDPWTCDIPTSSPAVASIADDSRSHSAMGRSSPCFGCHLLVWCPKATGRRLKASQTEGVCASLVVLLRRLLLWPSVLLAAYLA